MNDLEAMFDIYLEELYQVIFCFIFREKIDDKLSPDNLLIIIEIFLVNKISNLYYVALSFSSKDPGFNISPVF